MATHSCILAWRIPMDRGAWRATVHRVAKSWTWLKKTAHAVWDQGIAWISGSSRGSRRYCAACRFQHLVASRILSLMPSSLQSACLYIPFPHVSNLSASFLKRTCVITFRALRDNSGDYSHVKIPNSAKVCLSLLWPLLLSLESWYAQYFMCALQE